METVKREFKKIKDVTLPLLKIKVGTDYYVKFTSAMELGKEIAAQKIVNPETGEIELKKQNTPHVANVVNLQTDEPCQIICSAVFRSELIDAYPDESYVGKCFAFAINKVDGKRYNLVTISQIEDPTPSASTDAEPEKKSAKK